MSMLLVAVGKQRESYYQAAAAEYQRRLSRYCRLTLAEVQDEPDPGEQSLALMEKAKNTEGERILQRLSAADTIVALCIEGVTLTSERFSAQVKAWHEQPGRVVFVIGGSLGLSDAVLRRADFKLSLSAMTLPHQLARVVLLEQVYRAFKINRGERYHK